MFALPNRGGGGGKKHAKKKKRGKAKGKFQGGGAGGGVAAGVGVKHQMKQKQKLDTENKDMRESKGTDDDDVRMGWKMSLMILRTFLRKGIDDHREEAHAAEWVRNGEEVMSSNRGDS